MMKRIKGRLNCVCGMCGKAFHLPPCEIATGRGKYCSKTCEGKDRARRGLAWGGVRFKSGSDHPRWKGGKKMIPSGSVLCPQDFSPMIMPSWREDGRIEKHRLAMAQHLGRLLRSEEVVHHKNRDRTDNRIENLELFANQCGHNSLHHRMERRIKASAALF